MGTDETDNDDLHIYFSLLSGALAGLTKEETARASADEPVVIPDEAIRLRILANSDNDEDQKLKRQIRDAVNKQITDWVKDITSIEEARRLIRSKLPEIKEIAKQTMKEKVRINPFQFNSIKSRFRQSSTAIWSIRPENMKRF